MADYNSDWMSRRQDGELEELEKRLSALYSQASREVTEEFTKFTEEFASQEARMLELLAVGKIDDDDFRIWRNNHILQSVRYQELIKSLTNMMVDTDVSAMAIVSGDLPAVIAQSYNFMQALGWDAANQAGYSAGTFTIYNASAVQALIRDNPDLLPSVKKPIDEAWNMSKITREITQGIIQGNTMPQIADRLRRVVGMDENTAMRNARTAFTYAENMGRNESINNLQSRGIPMEKVWSAVMDNRTRQTHRLLNGTTPDKATGLYGVGLLAHPLRFPADKSGDAEEIYNCRCRLSGQFDSSIVDHSNDDELYEQFLRENYPNDYEALLDRDYFNQHTSKPLPRPEVAKPIMVNNFHTESNVYRDFDLEPMPEKPKRNDFRDENGDLLPEYYDLKDTYDRRLEEWEYRQKRNEIIKKGNIPQYATATTREEATNLLREMGFEISDDLSEMDEALFIQNANKLSELNSIFGNHTQGMKMRYFQMSEATASVDAIDFKPMSLNCSSEYYSDYNSLINSVQESIETNWIMPASSGYFTTQTITHEYGHILENTIIGQSDEYRSIADVAERLKYGRSLTDQYATEIRVIMSELNPSSDINDYFGNYAKSDNEEFFAECFQNALCGGRNEAGRAMAIWLGRRGFYI